MLEEEIYGENSPIWEADFTMPASDGTQLGHQTGEANLFFFVEWKHLVIQLLDCIHNNSKKYLFSNHLSGHLMVGL